MTFTTIIKFFKRNDEARETPRRFSDFFLNASEEKKEAVLTEAAHMANKEQMRVFEKARIKVTVN